VQGLDGFSFCFFKTSASVIDAKKFDERGFAACIIFAGRFADGLGIAFCVEQIVGNLEGEAKVLAIAPQRCAFVVCSSTE
jgi:hypothetical protein